MFGVIANLGFQGVKNVIIASLPIAAGVVIGTVALNAGEAGANATAGLLKSAKAKMAQKKAEATPAK